MRKNIYLIVGEGRCGKSSLVRALTGVYRGKALKIALSNPKGNEIKIAVWPQSAQEGKRTPEDVLNEINNLDDDTPNVLLVLRFEPHLINYWVSDYTDLLTKHHNILKVVRMGPNKDVMKISTLKDSKTINFSLSTAVNSNAAKVRNWWKWK